MLIDCMVEDGWNWNIGGYIGGSLARELVRYLGHPFGSPLHFNLSSLLFPSLPLPSLASSPTPR